MKAENLEGHIQKNKLNEEKDIRIAELEQEVEQLKLELKSNSQFETKKRDKLKTKMLHQGKELFFNLFLQTPVAFCVLEGPEHIFEFANPSFVRLIGRNNFLGLPIKEAMPELIEQNIPDILSRVFTTGKPFSAQEFPVSLTLQDGTQKNIFVNLGYETIKNFQEETYGILVTAYDVTDLVEARERKLETESQYRNLLKGLPIAIYTCDNEGYIQLFNDAAVKLWGKTPEVGKDQWCGSWKSFEANGMELPKEKSPMAVKDGEISQREIIMERPDGQKLNVIPYTQINYDKNGQRIGTIHTLIDISQIVKANNKMERNSEMLQEFYMSNSAFISILQGNEFEYELVNPAYQEMYPGEQLLGRKFKEVHPELKEQNIFSLLSQVYKTGKTFIGTELPIHLNRKGKGSELRYFNFSFQALYNEDKQIRGILIYGYDVTRQVLAKSESSRILVEILKSLPSITWTNTSTGEAIFVNEQWYEYTGNQQLKDWENIFHSDDLPLVKSKFSTTSIQSNKPIELEARYRRKDGIYRWHLIRSVPIFNSANEVEFWLGIATDIQAQKNKEEKKDEFISIASHEMKTPLTTATAYLQLLEQVLDPDHASFSYVEKARNAVERLRNLVAELVDVNKIQNGRLPYNLTHFNLNQLIQTIIDNFKLSFPEASIKTKGVFSRSLFADKNRIQQVLINLLTNAIKYSRTPADVRIEIKEDLEAVTLSIHDKGIGMSNEDIKKVFDRYYRAEDQKETAPGLGIGLYITKEIIERHHGEIWAESSLGKGSTFYFKLPVIE